MSTDNLFTKAGAMCLSNGRYSVLLTDAGSGHSSWQDFAISRWRGDWVEDYDGFLVYVRDPASGNYWTMGPQPVPAVGSDYAVTMVPGRVRYEHRCGDLELTLEVTVTPTTDCELRRVTVRNRGAQTRTVELTSYIELALNQHAADAAHPGFSKLFVQTERVDKLLLAQRRLRSPGENSPWIGHGILHAPMADCETDRTRFIGRGCTLANPQALALCGRLSQSIGNVLDPVFSLRTTLTVAAEATSECTFWLGSAPDRAGLIALDQELTRGIRGQATLPASDVKVEPDNVPEHIQGYLRGRAGSRASPHSPAPADIPVAVSSDKQTLHEEPLQFDNSYGGFNADGTEYVIRVRPQGTNGQRLPPMPWINVIANETLGCLISERGAGYTWSRNSREHRLSPWTNDPVSDPHSEAVWIRDRDSARYWSPMPGPTPANTDYEIRHGFGYSRFETECEEIAQFTRCFVVRTDPVKVTQIRLRNCSSRERRLSVYALQRLVLGVQCEDTQEHVVTANVADANILTAWNEQSGDFRGATAFSALSASVPGIKSFTSDRCAFIGRGSSMAAPRVVRDGLDLDGAVGRCGSPCLAWRMDITLAAGTEAEVCILFGECPTNAVADLVVKYCEPGRAEAAFADVRSFWRQTLSGVQIQSPAPGLDLMLNGWLLYQVLSCRLWARSAFYQSGGAYGFRDQLQDSMAFIHTEPTRSRAQLLLHAAHQFREGDVLHWWHPPASRGIRTRFSDDLLWLPLFTAFYIETTGDASILDERLEFLQAEQLAQDEDERFLLPQTSGEDGDLYEHCVRALDRSLTQGEHGLPLMGTGDWNDGMNRVGREGKGESVWVGFFLYDIIERFLPLCERRDDKTRHTRYKTYNDKLAVALNSAGWDGGWYRRAYYDDGTPLGSASNDECRIDALAQSWSVISGVAPPDRAALAMDAVEKHLVSEADGIIRLLKPPFDKTPHDAGYIKGYVPGIRENGGQYTHGALWVVQALAKMGRRDRAARLLEMLSPVAHGMTPSQVAQYQVEPYVIAADVYGTDPHIGRGGWTWYTGSAAWMYRIALEWIYGLRTVNGDTLYIKPCIPDDWPGYKLRYRLRDGATVYNIEVCRRDDQSSPSLTVDGKPTATEPGMGVVPLVLDSAEHNVILAL